jgi:hypothetical protein
MSLDKNSMNKNNNKNILDSNDPFEEFEFKPLTEGLGFHRSKESSKNTSAVHSKLEFRSPNLKFEPSEARTVETKTMSANFNTQQNTPLNTPLPRKDFSMDMPTPRVSPTLNRPQINVPIIEDDSIAKAQTAVNEILKNLNHKKQQEDILAKNKKRLIWKDEAPSILAGCLDTMLIAAGFLLMLIAMLAVTKVDLISNLSNPGENSIIWFATSALLATVTLIYMVVFRTYMGYTPGEWAFDQRCGTEIQQASSSYILKITLRSLFVMITGFLPVTILSIIARTDFIGALTGLQIQKQKYV